VFDQRARYSFTVWTSPNRVDCRGQQHPGNSTRRSRYHWLHGRSGQPIAGEHVPVLRPPIEHGGQLFRPGSLREPGQAENPWGLNYLAFVGNGLNTLSISANKIDTHLAFSGSVWWEPMGAYGEPGKSRNMYDDYFASKDVRIRIGTAFTRSREDRFSNLDQSNPENTSLYNSDGVLTFSTGAFRRVSIRPGDLQDVGGRRRPQVERAVGQRAILLALAQ
jgi:hypothetical protein